MAQLNKVLQVLDLFNEARPTLTAEDVPTLLGVSRTTAFRYLKQLCDAGMLTKLSGRYALGARIIQLDYKIRRYDPLLACSRDLMVALAASTTCSVLLSSLYLDEIVNVHLEAGQDGTAISFGRGRPLPLFRGAASKIILAHLPAARLKRLYDKYAPHPDLKELGEDLPAVSKFLRECRRNGCYVSHGEVDVCVTGMAAPIFNAEGHVIGSLALVFDSRREQLFNEGTLTEMLMGACRHITQQLSLPPATATATAGNATVTPTAGVPTTP